MTPAIRRIVLALFLALATTTANAQLGTMYSYFDGWRHAFSEEGMSEWWPEFTVRYSLGIRTRGPCVTAGIRVDRNRTLGIVAGQWRNYYPRNDAYTYTLGAGIYMRRYIHLSRRDVVAFYTDASAGVACVFKTTGGIVDPETGIVRGSSKQPGDLMIISSCEPGIRIRLLDNFHLFIGPTFATKCYGFHIGVGF
ncbi:MAG: hypothetical protein IJS30_07485 [Bacteroidales bacterium]|nr:hypothetical protein [Bacteroidales bacterium]